MRDNQVLRNWRRNLRNLLHKCSSRENGSLPKSVADPRDYFHETAAFPRTRMTSTLTKVRPAPTTEQDRHIGGNRCTVRRSQVQQYVPAVEPRERESEESASAKRPAREINDRAALVQRVPKLSIRRGPARMCNSPSARGSAFSTKLPWSGAWACSISIRGSPRIRCARETIGAVIDVAVAVWTFVSYLD